MNEHRLDSGALGDLNKILGATGGDPHTLIDSGMLQIALDVMPVVRRGRTLAGSEGLFTFFLQNVHTVGDETISTEIDPYAPASNLVGAGFPTPLPPGRDIWIMSLFAETTTGAGLFDSAFFSIKLPAAARGLFSPSTLGAAAMNQILFMSESENVIGGGVLIPAALAEVGTLTVSKLLGVRVPRGATVLWRTRTAAGVGTPKYTATGVFGVFPAGLGQDGLR